MPKKKVLPRPADLAPARTKKELLKLINPGRIFRKKWCYIAVDYYGMPYPEGYLIEQYSDEHYIGIHELHFDGRGSFLGITESDVTINAETVDGLFKQFERVRRDIHHNPVLTYEEFKLISEE